MKESNIDAYQERYLAHQQKKKKVLMQVMRDRYSERIFSDEDIPEDVIKEILSAVSLCPSSCDRKAIRTKLVSTRDDKELLSGLLVGGVGWVHRAKYIIIVFADPIAYKAGDEIQYMPFIDAGAVVQQLSLLTSANDLVGCFVNPTIRAHNKRHFHKTFGDDIFCGAYAIGKKPD